MKKIGSGAKQLIGRDMALSPVHMGKLTKGQDEEDKVAVVEKPHVPESGSSGSYDKVTTPTPGLAGDLKEIDRAEAEWHRAEGDAYRAHSEALASRANFANTDKVVAKLDWAEMDAASRRFKVAESDVEVKVAPQPITYAAVAADPPADGGAAVAEERAALRTHLAPIGAAREARRAGHKRRDKEPAPLTPDQQWVLTHHGVKEESTGKVDMSQPATAIVAGLTWETYGRDDLQPGSAYQIINSWPTVPQRTVAFIQKVALRHYSVGPVVAIKPVADTAAGLAERMRFGGYIDCGEFMRAAAVVQDDGVVSSMILYRFEREYTPIEAVIKALEREAYLKFLVSSSEKSPFSEMRGVKDGSYQLFARGIRTGTANLFIISGNRNYLVNGPALQALAAKFDISGRLAQAAETSVNMAWAKGSTSARGGGRGGRGRGGNRGGRGGFGQSRDRAGRAEVGVAAVQPADA